MSLSKLRDKIGYSILAASQYLEEKELDKRDYVFLISKAELGVLRKDGYYNESKTDIGFDGEGEKIVFGLPLRVVDDEQE